MTYGIATLRNTRKWELFTHKESSTLEQLNFLHKCKQRRILPNSINYQPPIRTNYAQQIAQSNGRRMLNVLISDAHNRLRIYRQRLYGYREAVINKTTETVANSIDSVIKQTTNVLRTRRHNQLERKFKNSRSYKQLHSNADTWVKNISDKPLTQQHSRSSERLKLQYERRCQIIDYVADLESALKNTEIPDETKQHIRHQIATNLNNKRPVKLDKEEQKTIKDLQNDNEIIILPADKGRMIVIMNKSDYIDKANTLLNDTETYQPLDTDPSKTTVNRINQKLKQLKDKDKLNETTYHRTRPNDATTAKFYGLPKVHKENIPLRPIVSLPGSPTYELSKYLAMILHPLVKTSPHTINNANDFLTNIKNLKLEPDEIMISFDVVSLFTSIPLDTAKRITNELLTNNDS